MSFNKKKWPLILGVAFLFTFALLILVTKALPRIIQGRVIECSELGVANLLPNRGTVTCLEKNFVFGAYRSIILEGNKLEPGLLTSFDLSKLNGSLTAQLIGPPTEPLIAEDETGKVIWSSNGTGTNWTAATRVSIPDLAQINVLKFRFNSPTKFEIVVSPMQVGDSSIVNILTLSLIFFGVVILSRKQNSPIESLTGCLLVYSAYIMFCGMPFGSSSGWFDSGDDTSYMHWAYNLGYHLNPDLKSTDYIKSWSLDHNHHPWGTGLLLAPFVFIVKLMKSGMTPNVIHFGFMNFGIIVMGFLSVLVLWRSFYLLFPSRLTLPI
ncbi:MAG: hypothetical protein NT027_02500, partial [Proteobacteria bacterium]|nr:hypothetical protein [Pseudomonadota bacterium]